MKLANAMKGKAKYLALAVPATVAASVPVLAESGSGTANSSVTTAMQTLASDMIATGNAIIPIALTVVGIAMVVRFGVRIFKSVAKP